MKRLLISAALAAIAFTGLEAGAKGLKKVEDLTVYRDSMFFSSFPSVVRTPEGDLLVAFRRAPNLRQTGETRNRHVDLNAYLTSVRSSDNGKTWTSDKPRVMYAHPFGGSQDPCMITLDDGSVLCASYAWNRTTGDIPASETKPKGVKAGTWGFLGGYLLKSTDGGRSWDGPIYPEPVPGTTQRTPYGNLVPAFNRGAMWQKRDGDLLWIVNRQSTNHLLLSPDRGETWNYVGKVSDNDSVAFNEASVIETPNGDIVGFLRCEAEGQPAHIARSTDGGKTFTCQSMGFHGVPLTATRLPDNRVLLVYGYRHEPYGIRARVLNPECTDWAEAEETVIRDDSVSPDCGYPWAVVLDDHRALIVYYLAGSDPVQTRYIGGTVVEF